MRTHVLIAAVAAGLFGVYGANLSSQGRGGGGGAAPVPSLSTDKTMFWSAADIQARWKENEALKRINSSIFNGPTNISANVRIVLPGDPPQTHETTADLWIVTEGTATARTDGLMIQTNGKPDIRNPTERPVHAGDVLYVPPGVPHHFTNIQGFRGWLIRFDTLGLVRTKPLTAQLPQPTLVHREVQCPWGLKGTVMRLLNERYANGHVDLLDGIKIFEERGWIQVLPDPDEPVVHLYAEGATPEQTDELEQELRSYLETMIEGEEIEASAGSREPEFSS